MFTRATIVAICCNVWAFGCTDQRPQDPEDSETQAVVVPALVQVTMVDGATNALIAQTLQVTVTGLDRNLVTDASGVPATAFTVAGGSLSFGLRTPGPVPLDFPRPAIITLVVQGTGYVPTSLPLTITTVPAQFSLRMANRTNPPAGVVTARASGNASRTGGVLSPILLQASEPVSGVTATVTVPAGTVITDASGAVVSGALTVDAAYFSPTVGSSLNAFPGGFSVDTTNTTSGITTRGEFVSAGLISLEIQNSAGLRAKQFSGDGIQIAMEIPGGTVNPLASRVVAPGDIIPVFSNDTGTGQWFEAGTAAIATAANGRLVARFNAKHLSLWNLDFKVDRCDNTGLSTTFLSKRITVIDFDEVPVCAGKMQQMRIQLSLNAGSPKSYVRTFVPTPTEPNVIQFMNAPRVNRSVIQLFTDTNHNGILDVGETVWGNHPFKGADNLCPTADNNAGTLEMFYSMADLPGSC